MLLPRFICILSCFSRFWGSATGLSGWWKQYPLKPSDEILTDRRLGAIASENQQCSKIGFDLLSVGGNAADAVVGAVFCIGVMNMYHSGIGGGGYMLVRGPDGTYETIDFRETAPAAATEEMFHENRSSSVFGGRASAVPGELRGLEYLHRRYGKLPWRKVMMPAINLARNGFTVSDDLFRYMTQETQDYDFLTNDPAWALDFAPNGTRVGPGDTMSRHRGPLAQITINALQKKNGIMTLNDLAEYGIISRKPVEINYHDFRILSCGAPASGAVALSALKTVERYLGFGDPEMINLTTHRLDEAIRFAYAGRALLGDPDFSGQTAVLERKMLTEESAANRREKISDKHTLNVSEYDPGNFEIVNDHGTSHIVAADSSGLAISLTTTVNLIFGSRLMVPETGVVMNNEMNDFSVPETPDEFGYVPSPENYIAPRKRPFSSATPIIVEHKHNNSLHYLVGGAGGSRIITSVLQNLWHVLDSDMSAFEALEQPRFHDQLLPNVIDFEWGHKNNNTGADKKEMESQRAESGIGTGDVEGYDNQTVAFMIDRGHKVTWVPPGYSSVHAIKLWWDGSWEAAAEPRQKNSGGFGS